MKRLFFAILPVLAISCTGGYKISGIVPEGVDSVRFRVIDTAEVINSTVAVSTDGSFNFSGKLSEVSNAVITMKGKDEKTFGVRFAMFNDDIKVVLDTASRGGLAVEGNATGNKIDELTQIIYSSESDDTPFLLIDSLLSANPADKLVPFLFNDMKYYLSLQQYDAILSKVDASLKDNMYFASNAAHFECLRKTDVGKPFTDFTCPTADGQPLQLSSLAGKGTWLLVDFWASWCVPCRAENPNVVAAYRKYHEKGFDILGVSLDRDAEKWAQAIEHDSLTWTHVSDLKMWDSPSRIEYGIMAIPANILIAPDGTIAARDLRGKKLEEFLSEKLD